MQVLPPPGCFHGPFVSVDMLMDIFLRLILPEKGKFFGMLNLIQKKKYVFLMHDSNWNSVYTYSGPSIDYSITYKIN